MKHESLRRMYTVQKSLSRQLLANDEDLGNLVGSLARDLRVAGASCSQARWNRLEGKILDRIEAEEAFFSPTFDSTHPVVGALIHEAHARLRYRLADLRTFVECSTLSTKDVGDLLWFLRDLSSQKQALVYPSADDLDDELASLVLHRLGGTVVIESPRVLETGAE